jgi:hypothetical protein
VKGRSSLIGGGKGRCVGTRPEVLRRPRLSGGRAGERGSQDEPGIAASGRRQVSRCLQLGVVLTPAAGRHRTAVESSVRPLRCCPRNFVFPFVNLGMDLKQSAGRTRGSRRSFVCGRDCANCKDRAVTSGLLAARTHTRATLDRPRRFNGLYRARCRLDPKACRLPAEQP